MLTRIMIGLSEPELNALRMVAERDMRGLREQARFLVCAELQRLGLLMSETHPRPQRRHDGISDISDVSDMSGEMP